MKRLWVLVLAVFALMALSGCGGSGGGSNSNFVIHLNRTDGTQDMTQFEVYITRNAATTFNLADSESFGSTGNHPTWMDQYSAVRATTELTLNFRSRSDQTP
ncbi:MAG: hypothetical protein ABUL49_01085, partial [bacterium]